MTLRKRLTQRKRFASLLRAVFQWLVVKRFQAQPHANWTCFRWYEKWALTILTRNLTQINGPWCKIWRTWQWLCFVNTSSATFPVQWDSSFCGRMVLVEKYIGAECICPNQGSDGLESFGIHLQWERFESAKARTGSPFGTAVQIQKGANEGQTLKSLEFVSQSLYLKDARGQIKRLLVKRATVCVSTCVRHSCMHLQSALRLSAWSGCENVHISLAWSKISRSSLPDARRQQVECMILFWRPLVSKHIQALSHPH